MNKIIQGDCLIELRNLPENSVDSIVTDPPYELGFMGKSWDNTGIANNVEMWKECLRVLKPGGHLLSFGGTRTYHRMASAIEDAGFEVRECFPESNGRYGAVNTGNVKFSPADYGTGQKDSGGTKDSGNASRFFKLIPIEEQDEIQEECTDMEEKLEKLGLEQQDLQKNTDEYWNNQSVYTKSIIYQAKASKSERNKGCEGMPEKRPDERTETGMGTFEEKGVAKQSNFHPTVKPIALMEYLIKMVTPKGGVVLDPFAGSGSTLVAAKQNGFQYIGIEMTEEYIPIIEARLSSQITINKMK